MGVTPVRRIRVGFMSSWFCNSAIGRLMLGVVRNLDRAHFWVGVFHAESIDGVLKQDEYYTQEYYDSADHVAIVRLATGEGPDNTVPASTLGALGSNVRN